MTDVIIKGDGTSRTLKTVENALELYPTWPDALRAMIDGTFLIDLGNLRSAGVSRMPTPLNKANLLTDATERAIWGSANDRSVDAALAQLRTQNATAQATADAATETGDNILRQLPTKLTAVFGEYLGNGERTKSLSFKNTVLNGLPKLLIVRGNRGICLIAFQGQDKLLPYLEFVLNASELIITWDSATGTVTTTPETSDGINWINRQDVHYYYVGLG